MKQAMITAAGINIHGLDAHAVSIIARNLRKSYRDIKRERGGDGIHTLTHMMILTYQHILTELEG